MDVATLEERYLKITKRFGKLAGIWPYESKFSKYFARFIINLTAFAAFTTQMTQYIDSLDIAVIPFTVATFGVFLKQWTYIINVAKFKLLLDGMYEDWTTGRSKEELDIMTMYAKRSVFFTSFYVGNAYICVLVFVNLPYVPRILDKILPQNESRNLLFIYPAHYPFDQEKYYYLITAHMSFMIIIVLFVFAASDTIYMYMVQHACGLLAVSGLRFKYAVEDLSMDKKKTNVETPNEIYRKVCYAVQGHERANQYLKEIESVHFYYLLVCVPLVMVSFSITLVKMSLMQINAEFYKFCSFLVVQLMHIFFLSIQGQFLIDSSDEFYNIIYEGMWYNTQVKTQALYILALRRSLSPLQITAGGFFTMNLQSFSEVIKTSVSYFTVMKSAS